MFKTCDHTKIRTIFVTFTKKLTANENIPYISPAITTTKILTHPICHRPERAPLKRAKDALPALSRRREEQNTAVAAWQHGPVIAGQSTTSLLVALLIACANKQMNAENGTERCNSSSTFMIYSHRVHHCEAVKDKNTYRNK